eukprot:scaffold279288_cov31-Tisochrysis_lutea.AAC.2
MPYLPASNRAPSCQPNLQPRYWTPEEHRLFMEAVQRYGWKDVKSIAQHVGTRTPTQVRTHAQKLFLRQQKEQTGVMQPVKNGRADMPPFNAGASTASSPTPADSPSAESKGLPQTGFLNQLTDAAEGMDTSGEGGGPDEGAPRSRGTEAPSGGSMEAPAPA